MISKYPAIQSRQLFSLNIKCLLCSLNICKLATLYKMSFIQALILLYTILNMNWTIKGYSQLEIGSQVNNGAMTVNLGSDSVDDETVESNGMLLKNVDI